MNCSRKSLKATCSLLPLFGLLWIIAWYHEPKSSVGLYEIFLLLLQNLQVELTKTRNLMMNFQGVFIATIYCFMNKDVQRMVKSRFTRVVQRHSSAFYSQGTTNSQLSVSEVAKRARDSRCFEQGSTNILTKNISFLN